MRRLNVGVLRKLLTLTAPEWKALLGAQAALIRAQLLVWTRPRGQLFLAGPDAPRASSTEGVGSPVLQRLASAVERAADHGLYRPSCLVRSLALQRLLTSHGITGSVVRVGVRVAGARFTAHAWVEYRGQVLADREWRVRRFEQLTQLEVHERS
jgi:hypothetical protein